MSFARGSGRTEAAIEGLELAVKRSIDTGNLPLAVAAVADLRKLGRPTDKYFDENAKSCCRDSPRLTDAAPAAAAASDVRAVSTAVVFFGGPRAVVESHVDRSRSVRKIERADGELTPITPLPLFSAIEMEGLRALIGAFENDHRSCRK